MRKIFNAFCCLIVMLLIFLSANAEAANKSSAIACMASLTKKGASVDELRVALALQELFYCRFCQISGITTLMTIDEGLNTDYGRPLTITMDDEWIVPHFSSADEAIPFARKHKIDVLFFGNLSFKAGMYMISIQSTNRKAKTVKFECADIQLCDKWLEAICKLADHVGVKLDTNQEKKIRSNSTRNIMDIVTLGAMMRDVEIEGSLGPDEDFMKIIGADKKGEKALQDFLFKCELPETFYKLSYYMHQGDTEFGWMYFLSAIGRNNNFSKPFYFLRLSSIPTLPRHILEDQGYGTAKLFNNLRKFKIDGAYIEKVRSNIKKELMDTHMWYCRQVLEKDEDDYMARGTLLVYLALQNERDKFKEQASKLKKQYPEYAGQIFSKVVLPHIRTDKKKWIKEFSDSK